MECLSKPAKNYAVMNTRILGLLCCLLGFLPVAQAQFSPYYDYLYLYEEAHELFEKEKYGAAIKMVDRYLMQEDDMRAGPNANDLHANARYIQAVSAYHLERANAENLLRNYITEFSTNTKASQASFFLGSYYFDRRNYRAAIEVLKEAKSSSTLSKERRAQAQYYLGYCFYQEKDYQAALGQFSQVASSPDDNPYKEDARYYEAVILYEIKDFEGAETALKALQGSDKYGSETRIYLANTLMARKKYDELYVLAEELISGPRVKKDEAQVYYVVANASFERKDYNRTTEYFRLFEQARGRMTRNDQFRNGYSLYQLAQYEAAVPSLQRALGRNTYDSLTQVASYYLGFCFLEMKDEPNARVAFDKAAKGAQFGNAEVAKDALYQYARLSFSTENYSDALEAFTRLTEEYPNESFIPEIQGLVGDTYLKTRDYSKAVRYFESVPRTTARARKAYQIVCYFYGIELFEKPDYRRAELYFRKAKDNPFDADLALSAAYWQAETKFRGGAYKEAAADFKTYLNSPGAGNNEFNLRGYYGLGWARFKMKEYSYAYTNFNTYTQRGKGKEPTKLVVDAYLRAGDCQFLLKNYSKGIESYRQVVRFGYAYGDYATYQIGESYYRVSNYTNSVDAFDRLIRVFKKSEFRDDALDRISEIYITWIKNNNEAFKYAKMLVDEYPRSPLAPDAYNRLALASYNLGNQNAAVSYYKKVVTDYGADQDAAQTALDNLALLIPGPEFDRILRDYRNQNPDIGNNANLASLLFNTGKDRFFAENYSSAIDQFSTYLRDYPTGPDYFEALVLRGRSYRALGQSNKAKNDFLAVYSASTTNAFTSAALEEAAEMEFEEGNYREAIDLYQVLSETAGAIQNRVVAWFGLAKGYKELGDYGRAQDALLKIADSNEADVYSRTEALVEIGRCQYLDNELEDAFLTFSTVEQDFKNIFGAESQYMKAQILLDQGIILKEQGLVTEAEAKFTEVKDATRYMANNYPTFNYEKAKTFLVVAEAFFQLGNSFQAKGTLESLASEDRFPDVKQAALKRLAEIEAEEGTGN